MRRLVFDTQYFHKQERYLGRISRFLCPASRRYGIRLKQIAKSFYAVILLNGDLPAGSQVGRKE